MEPAAAGTAEGQRAPRPRPMSVAELTSAVRAWAAQHEDGAAEDAMQDLGLPGQPNLQNAQDTLIIIRGILARFRWNQQGLHQRNPRTGTPAIRKQS